MKQICLTFCGQLFIYQLWMVFKLECPVLLGRDYAILQQIIAASGATSAPLPDFPLGEGDLAHLSEMDPKLCHALGQAQKAEAALGAGPHLHMQNRFLYRQEGNVTLLVVLMPLWE